MVKSMTSIDVSKIFNTSVELLSKRYVVILINLAGWNKPLGMSLLFHIKSVTL